MDVALWWSLLAPRVVAVVNLTGALLLRCCYCSRCQIFIADSGNHRICIYTVAGELVTTLGGRFLGFNRPFDVLESESDSTLVVVNWFGNNLIKLSREGKRVGVFGQEGTRNGEFDKPSAIYLLPDGGLVVRENGERERFQVFALPVASSS